MQHQGLRTDKKPKGLKRTEMKRGERLKPVSEKLKKERKIYSRLRKQFLLENPRCAVFPWLKATEVHHKRGRGKYLNDVSTWLAVSHEGHRKIEENPEWAKEMGYSLPRNSK